MLNEREFGQLIRRARKEVSIEKVLTYCNVEMRKIGIHTFVKCPYHNDTNPSALIDIEHNKLKCFVCMNDRNENKSTIDLLMDLKGLNFQQAVKVALELEGIEVKYNNDLKVKAELRNYDNNSKYSMYELLKNNCRTKDYYTIKYLKDRGIFLYDNDANEYGLEGINEILKDNNIEILKNSYLDNGKWINKIVYHFTYPINSYNKFELDIEEEEDFYITKKLVKIEGDKFRVQNAGSAKPKYIEVKRQQEEIYVVEGIEDALSLIQGKKANVFSLNSVNNLSQFKEMVLNTKCYLDKTYVLALDNDKAGRSATEDLIEFFTENNIKYKIYENLVKANQIVSTIKDVNDLWKYNLPKLKKK